MVDGCCSKLVGVVSGMLQGSVLGSLLFLLYTSELFSILENKLIGYADDSSLMAVVPSPGVRVTVEESLIRDLGRVSESPPLTIGGTVLKESDDFVILGVTFDSKLTFEKHPRLPS